MANIDLRGRLRGKLGIVLIILLLALMVSLTFTFQKDITRGAIPGASSISGSKEGFIAIAPASNTCAPPESGNWELSCADNCTWAANQTVPGNITMSGGGVLNLSAYFVFTGKYQHIFINPKCELNIYPGGGFA